MLKFAAILAFLLGLAHSVLGERFILVRLFRNEKLPKLFGGTEFTTGTLRFAWHITTVLWWGFAVLLWQLGNGSASPELTLRVIGYTSIAGALLPLVITRGKHLSWVILLVIGAIALSQAAT